MSRLLMFRLTYWVMPLLIGTIIGPQSQAFWWKKPTVVVEAVSVAGFQGVRLKGRLFQPKTMLASRESRPTIILISPWSVGIHIYETKARELAQRGYQVLAYSSRGWAGSEGEIDTGGPLDIADAQLLLDWLIEEHQADPDRIGAAGISLGAGTALLAAAHDPRIKAVVSLSGWTEMYTSLLGNNTERLVWGTILDAVAMIGGGKFSPGHHVNQKEILKNRQIEKLRAYTDHRSPINYLDRFLDHQTAIFISHNINDYLFPSSDIWNFFQKLQSPKAIRLQPGIHASTEVIEIFGIGEEIWDDTFSWFDQWLGNGSSSHPGWNDTSIAVRPINNNRRLQVDLQGIERALPERWFLSAGSRWDWGDLLADENAVKCCDQFRSGKYSGINSGVPLVYPLINSFVSLSTNINPLLIRKSLAAVYKLEHQPQAFDILGIPRIHLSLDSNREVGQIVVYLFRIDQGGKWHLVSLAPYTFLNQIPGQPFTIETEFFNGFATIGAGEQLVLAIDTYDLQFSPIAGPRFDITIRSDLGAYLDLPMQIH